MVQNEAQYVALVDSPHAFRAHLNDSFAQHPELFPPDFSDGYELHSIRSSKKLDLRFRRIRINATRQVYLVRPCFVMPYCSARVSELENPLFLRLWGVSFDALSWCFERPPKVYERAFLALGRVNLVASTFKCALPSDLVADEKHITGKRPTSYLCVTASQGCVVGAEVVAEADAEHFAKGYGVMLKEAREVEHEWTPRSVCLDGFRATQAAFKELLPGVRVILCFLHAMLKLRQVSPKKTREEKTYQALIEKGWEVYDSPSRRHFSQRLRRLGEWSAKHLTRGKLKHEVSKMVEKSRKYSIAYECAGCYRTSNQVDRVMSHQTHMLRAQRGCHGTHEHASQMMRAHGTLWNFHPYGVRMRRDDPERRSPFHDVNGFAYHENWLSNFLLASSVQGLGRAPHQKRRS